MNFCLNCGEKLPIKDPHFCPYCGFCLTPYISKENNQNEIKESSNDRKSKAKEEPVAESASTNLGEEVKNLKDNFVLQDSETSEKAYKPKEMENSQLVDDKQEKEETTNHLNNVINGVEKDSSFKQPVPASAKESDDVKQSDNLEDQQEIKNEDVVDTPDEDIVTTPDPEIPASSQRDRKINYVQNQTVLVHPEEVELNTKDENAEDPDENSESKDQEEISSSKENNDSESKDVISSDEVASAVELPNLSNNDDTKEEYYQDNSKSDEDVRQNTESKVNTSENNDDVDDASELLNTLAHSTNKENSKDKLNSDLQNSDNKSDDEETITKVSEIETDPIPTELPDEYAPKHAQTDPETTTTMQPDEEVTDSVHGERQLSHAQHPFDSKESKKQIKNYDKKQTPSYHKSNFGFPIWGKEK